VIANPAVVPEFYVTDLGRSLRFYVDALGFEIDYERPESRFAALSFRGSRIMLEEISGTRAASDEEFAQGGWRTGDLEFPFGRGVSLQISVLDVESAHARVLALGYQVRLGLRNRTYRMGDEVVEQRQFLVLDPDGYLIRLAQQH